MKKLSHVFRRRKLLLICLIASMVFSLAKVSVPVSSHPGTKVYVKMPAEGYINGTEIGVNNTFTVGVHIENATDLVQWSLSVQVDPNVLNISSVEDPRVPGTVIYDYAYSQYMTDVWQVDSVIPEEGKIYNNSHGISQWPLLYPTPGGYDGNGLLCNLTFKVLDETAYSPIHLSDVLLFDGQNWTTGTAHYFPPDIVEDGHFNPPPAGGDAAVTNVVPSFSEAYPTWGGSPYYAYDIHVNVTVLNNGTLPLNCTVAAYYNSSTWYEIGTQNVTLAESESTTLTFNWTLSDVPDNVTHTIKANATLIDLADIYLNNNEKVDGQVKVRLWGDVNDNGKVQGDWLDTKKVKLGRDGYIDISQEPFADINGNGYVLGDWLDFKKSKMLRDGYL